MFELYVRCVRGVKFPTAVQVLVHVGVNGMRSGWLGQVV